MALLGGSISAGGDVHVAKTESYFGQTAVRPGPCPCSASGVAYTSCRMA